MRRPPTRRASNSHQASTGPTSATRRRPRDPSLRSNPIPHREARGIIYLAIVVAVIAGWWQIFTKAGEAGWKAIIPIYNVIVILKIVGRETWWVILMLIPIVSFIVWIVVAIDLAKSFGRGTGFGVGLALLSPIFSLMLGFGSDTYKGPAAKAA